MKNHKEQKRIQSSFLVLIIGAVFSAAAGVHLYCVLEHQLEENVKSVSTIYAERTESTINSIFHKTDVLAAVIKMKNGEISEEEFNNAAALVYQEDAGIRGIQSMPGAVVTYSYPIEGNEEVMGKNFLEIPARRKDVLLAIDTKKIALSGPYTLLQGGLGVVARNPIFLTDATGKEYFWGFSAIVLDLPDALSSVQLDHLQDTGYDYQLFNINENNERIVIDGNQDLDTSKAVCSSVYVPNHEWTLAISSKKPWSPFIAGTGTFLIGIVLTIILYNFLKLMRREKEAVASKDNFFSNISHDMRTPLNAVLGFTQLARSDNLTLEEKDQYLAKIETSGNLLLELVNDTLLLSKESNGKLALHLEPISLQELENSLLSPLQQRAEAKGIQLIVKHLADQKYVVLSDRLYLEKILLNLITNAIKYTPKGGHVWVDSTCSRIDEQHVKTVFSIKDDGIGMSPEFQKNMFEPFVQENRVGYESNGTGLGLAIVKQTVELLHGSITVNSQLNVGTEFEVAIPFELTEEKTVTAPQTITDFHALAGKTVLVCEDNALNLEIAKTLLQEKGMQVVSAVNGELGFKAFVQSEEYELDAILMDLRMPIMDGLTATKKIRAVKRQDAASIPIIAMTADVFRDDVEKCKEAGMNEHIAKPIDPEKLYAVLLKYITRA
jgi:signal transduction histidine kinase/CheY-like chemotaxis protein